MTTTSSTGLPPSLPLRRDAADGDGGGVATALLFLLTLLAAAAFMLWRRRATAGGKRGWGPWLAHEPPRALRKASSQALTSHASVHVVVWRGEELLLGCTPHSVSVLARQPAATQASDTGAGASQ